MDRARIIERSVKLRIGLASGTFAMRRGFGPFAAGLADGFAGGASDDVARRTGENCFAADLPADNRRTQDPLRRVGDVRAQDALAERNGRIPTARWQARHLLFNTIIFLII